jgi:2-dehydropantoate 2-reductase
VSQVGRYVIIGGGAVGGALAAQLAPAGKDVVLVARGEHGKRVATDGLRVRRPGRVDLVEVPVVSGPDDLALRDGDVLLLAVKAQDAEAALAVWAWEPVHDEAGSAVGTAATALPVVTLQNGVVTEDLALRRFEHVYGATIAIAASYLTPGEIVSPSEEPVGVVWLGRHPGGSDDLQATIVRDLVESGFAAFSVDDTRAQKAAKLLGNLSNGLDLLDGPDDLRAEARDRLQAEGLAVLTAAGVPLPPGGRLDLHGVDFTVEAVEGHEPGRRSTWQSFARGASSEVDYLNGEIVLLARRHGVDAPLNQRLQELLGAAHLADRRTLADLLG